MPERLTQLRIRNATLAAVSRAPYAKLAAYRQRMGWTFPWYSSAGTDFNYDFHATIDDRVAPVLLNFRTEAVLAETGAPWTESRRGDWPGISAFLRIGGEVCHTYSTFGRGIDLVGGPPGLLGHYLDLTALGRQEEWEEPKGRATPSACRPVAPTCASPTNTTAVPEPSGRELQATTWRVAGLGAVIAGRRTYDTSLPWWGADGPTGPARVPVFVLSHDEPEDPPAGGVYTFVTGGIEDALMQAKAAAHLRFRVVR
jgi:hypothetical protein